MLEGGCNCGQVRYSIAAQPVAVAQCHCSNCRRQSGSAFSVNLVVPKDAVTSSGEMTCYVDGDTASGNPVNRKFCPKCGSPIFSELAAGPMVVVKAGTLDDPAPFAPGISVWTSTRLPWVEVAQGIPCFERNPG